MKWVFFKSLYQADGTTTGPSFQGTKELLASPFQSFFVCIEGMGLQSYCGLRGNTLPILAVVPKDKEGSYYEPPFPQQRLVSPATHSSLTVSLRDPDGELVPNLLASTNLSIAVEQKP